MTGSHILMYTDGEAMGDGIIRIPFFAAIKHALPDAHITVACGNASVYTGALNELAARYIDAIIALPSRAIPLREYLLGPRAFRGQRFDIVIDSQRNFKRALWLSRVPHGIFISAAGNYILSRYKPLIPRTGRAVDQLFNLGELALGVRLTPQPILLPDAKWAAAAQAYLAHGSRVIGFVIGAGHPDKCWKFESFIALAQECAAFGDIPVFLLGPQEAGLAATIRTAIPSARIPLLDAPPLAAEFGIDAASPYFTIALGGFLSACIANDSGGGHLAAAGGAAMVTLFRSNSVREKFTPDAPRVIALTPEDFGLETMRDIPLEAVRAALREILQH